MTNKIIRGFLTAVIIVGALYTLFCGVWSVLPDSIKEQIPQFTWLTALISGGSSATISGLLLVVRNIAADTKNTVIKEYNTLVEQVKDAYAYIDTFKTTINELKSNLQVEQLKNKALESKLDLLNSYERIKALKSIENPLTSSSIKEQYAKILEQIDK